ncbi:hypothetical protein BJ508DRAFT_411267 [Ascobolus immersus RN42]|uniref:Uncharacterized protein n=1 Tax=Ascobolus immersus RN42 TaxID=1160509 RepID=A0A3N4IPE4_ASCIM|nr:hypothetical protein BJ508DRAFT_411267 [Ascobolus immersus RN42]
MTTTRTRCDPEEPQVSAVIAKQLRLLAQLDENGASRTEISIVAIEVFHTFFSRVIHLSDIDLTILYPENENPTMIEIRSDSGFYEPYIEILRQETRGDICSWLPGGSQRSLIDDFIGGIKRFRVLFALARTMADCLDGLSIPSYLLTDLKHHELIVVCVRIAQFSCWNVFVHGIPPNLALKRSLKAAEFERRVRAGLLRKTQADLIDLCLDRMFQEFKSFVYVSGAFEVTWPGQDGSWDIDVRSYVKGNHFLMVLHTKFGRAEGLAGSDWENEEWFTNAQWYVREYMMRTFFSLFTFLVDLRSESIESRIWRHLQEE